MITCILMFIVTLLLCVQNKSNANVLSCPQDSEVLGGWVVGEQQFHSTQASLRFCTSSAKTTLDYRSQHGLAWKGTLKTILF